MSSALSTVIGVINAGLDGKGRASIHASKKGLRVVLNGRTLARGRTPDELHANFQNMIASAQHSKPKP